ncbi:glycosyltransferase family 2 protein [Francisella sp. SYW-9]|uniref:glycosyltransferase family 2 protein n=1 Tax=Francisella sp. SYW-9 TaxID=2610888 RepID=UPI00123C919B|nr:glycosyltransferase family 2 protein [Francisella sp. SYW-9]
MKASHSCNLCIVIPIYNHGKQLPNTIENISKYNLPIILIDDGNQDNTKEVIKKIANEFKNIILTESFDKNQGKGVAVSYGTKLAFEMGYTHMLQIDADGQHNSNDIPKFIQAMKDNPQALISGMPIYDDSIPKSRLHGRKITNFWVAIETLSFNLKESMCGFRIYPLQAYIKLMKKRAFSVKMDFDIDVIVRMYWLGLPIIYINTKVIYPQDGYSNFRMFKDNVRISWTHTKLVTGMILRLPILLWRKIR